MYRKSPNRERILLLLSAGLVLSLKRSPRGYFKLISNISDEWKKIGQRALDKSVRDLYRSKLVHQKSNPDGTTTFLISKEGERVALTYNLDNMTIAKHKWDRIWRIVMFDVPEKRKKVRDAIRYHLKKLGFLEYQRSVFIIPFECKEEIEYLVEFHNARRFVRYLEVTHMDDERALLDKFKIAH